MVGELLPIGDLTLLTTEGSGMTANADLGLAVIGVHTNVVLDDAAIGGRPLAIGISTIIRWMGRPTSFPTSNTQTPQSNKSRRRRAPTPDVRCDIPRHASPDSGRRELPPTRYGPSHSSNFLTRANGRFFRHRAGRRRLQFSVVHRQRQFEWLLNP